MTSTSPQKARFLLAGALIFAHLAAFFLAPWSHRHLDEGHAGTDGLFHHAHILLAASSPPEVAREDHHQEGEEHLLTGESRLLEAMPESREAHHEKIVALFDSAANTGLWGLPSVLIPPSPSAAFVKSLLKPLHVLPSQDNSVLIETDLPPPLA